MNISNTQKQARFRKKEALKRGADRIFNEWQTFPRGSQLPAEDVLELIQKASELPTGWTDEDYHCAIEKLEQLRLDLLTNANDLSNDVHSAYSTDPATGQVRFVPGAVDAARSDVEIGYELARHMISAIRLSKASEIATSAAVMEVVRHVSRNLVLSSEVPRSRATAACLTALPQSSSRPEWFADEVVKMLQDRLGIELCHEIAAKIESGRKSDFWLG